MDSAALSPAEKVKQFPTTPGVYLMKDAQGVVQATALTIQPPNASGTCTFAGGGFGGGFGGRGGPPTGGG